MKKEFIIILIFLIVITVYVVLMNNISVVININWKGKLSIPISDEIVYQIQDNNRFHGDGDRYVVIKYENQNKIKKIKKMGWQDNIDEKDLELIDSMLEKFLVPNEYLPVLDGNILYIKRKQSLNDWIIVAYDSQNNLMYIFESFM